MHKIMPILLMLALMSTSGCTGLLESTRDLYEWRDSLNLPQRPTAMRQQQMQQQYGQPVYRAQDCIGAVVNGVCHGSTGAAQPRTTCHGQMINGQCTGPLF